MLFAKILKPSFAFRHVKHHRRMHYGNVAAVISVQRHLCSMR